MTDNTATSLPAPTIAEVSSALETSNELAKTLNDRVQVLGCEVASLRSQVATLTGERDSAVATASAATAEVTKLRASVPSMASAQAMQILAGFGVNPDTGARPSKTMPASAGAGSVSEQFKAMRPGSPEANQFFAEHRKALLG